MLNFLVVFSKFSTIELIILFRLHAFLYSRLQYCSSSCNSDEIVIREAVGVARSLSDPTFWFWRVPARALAIKNAVGRKVPRFVEVVQGRQRCSYSDTAKEFVNHVTHMTASLNTDNTTRFSGCEDISRFTFKHLK